MTPDRHFEEWKKFVQRRAPALLSTMTEKEARAIFDQAFAQGEQHIENVRAREARARGEWKGEHYE